MATLKSKQQYSRRKARKLFKDHYAITSISRAYHVHHRDLDPLNNDVNNLELLSMSEHMKLHWFYRESDTLLRQLNRLESVLIVCNTFGYHY